MCNIQVFVLLVVELDCETFPAASTAQQKILRGIENPEIYERNF